MSFTYEYMKEPSKISMQFNPVSTTEIQKNMTEISGTEWLFQESVKTVGVK